MRRLNRFCWIIAGGALLLIAPAWAAAQDPVPSPPKQETVTIRAVGGAFELKTTSSVDQFVFTEQCESKAGYAESTVLLTLPFEIEVGPNDSLEHATKPLREAVAQGLEVVVEPSSERGKILTFSWGGTPGFQGVVESLSVKYTMFMPDGTPARATVGLKMRQANRVLNKGEAKEANKKKKPDCSPSQY